jgi:hypothetical protein
VVLVLSCCGAGPVLLLLLQGAAATESADGQQEGGMPARTQPADGWEATMTNFNHWSLNGKGRWAL